MRYFVINIHEMKGGGAAKPPRAKGELTFGKLAAAVMFRLRAGACGFGIDQDDRFFACAAGGQEDPQA